MSLTPPPLVRIVGCSGGLGASSLACALAGELAAEGLPVVLADADTSGGGLDTTAAVEHLPGLRWGDLAGLEGPVDAAALIQALPGHDIPVLAAGGGLAAHETVAGVLTALAVAATVVVDHPRWLVPLHPGGVGASEAHVLVAGLNPRHLRDAEAVVDVWPDVACGVVTRGRRHDDLVSEAVAAHLGLPLLGHLAEDPRCAADEVRGRFPGSRGGALTRLARRLATGLPQLVVDPGGTEPVPVAQRRPVAAGLPAGAR